MTSKYLKKNEELTCKKENCTEKIKMIEGDLESLKYYYCDGPTCKEEIYHYKCADDQLAASSFR
jgi:hypothetical protein